MDSLPKRIDGPSWWQLMNWISDPIGFIQKMRQKYGDVFVMDLGKPGDFVVVGDPQVIQDLFSKDPKQFDVGRANHLAEPLLGQNSLILLDGERHRRERKLLMPSFHGERLQTYAQQICQITEQCIDRWQVGQPFIARRAMQQISLEVILRVVFGLSDGERYQQIKPLLTAWIDVIDSPLRSSMLFLKFLQHDWGNWSPWGRMKQRQRQIHALLQEEIEARRSQHQEDATDILTLMMAARDENGQAMTDPELRDELLTLLFAGHETTATILAWAFYQICQNPAIRERLLDELGSGGNNDDGLKIAQLPYLSAVCQETLRLYPVIPGLFPRVARSAMEIGGHRYEPETKFLPIIYLVHSREDLYPDPEQFKPERFLDRQYSPAEYFPFGGGNRRCLGYALAQLEMKLVLARVLSRCELTLLDTQPVKIQRRGFTLAPEGGVRLMLKGMRQSPSLVGTLSERPA